MDGAPRAVHEDTIAVHIDAELERQARLIEHLGFEAGLTLDDARAISRSFFRAELTHRAAAGRTLPPDQATTRGA